MRKKYLSLKIRQNNNNKDTVSHTVDREQRIVWWQLLVVGLTVAGWKMLMYRQTLPPSG